MTTPIWLLDVDGVINCFPAPKPGVVRRFGPFEHVEVLGFPIWFRPALVEFINRMHDEELVQIRWLTTWNKKAATDLAPALGLPQVGVIAGGETNEKWHVGGWWKLARVREIAAAGEPFIWTDDEIDKPMRLELAAPDRLIFRPHSCPGLTTDHEERIEEFLRGWAGDE